MNKKVFIDTAQLEIFSLLLEIKLSVLVLEIYFKSVFGLRRSHSLRIVYCKVLYLFLVYLCNMRFISELKRTTLFTPGFLSASQHFQHNAHSGLSNLKVPTPNCAFDKKERCLLSSLKSTTIYSGLWSIALKESTKILKISN